MNINDARLPPSFWNKVVLDETTVDGLHAGCWLWTGNLNNSGYAMYKPPKPMNLKFGTAHRIAYKVLVGPIADGLTCDHICNIPRCVNPSHIRLATVRENVLRSTTGPTAINSRKTHCKHGHPFTQENTSKLASGYRQCLTCHRLAGVQQRAALSPEKRALKLERKRQYMRASRAK